MPRRPPEWADVFAVDHGKPAIAETRAGPRWRSTRVQSRRPIPRGRRSLGKRARRVAATRGPPAAARPESATRGPPITPDVAADSRTRIGAPRRWPVSASPGRSSISSPSARRTSRESRAAARRARPPAPENLTPRWIGKMPSALSKPTMASTAPWSMSRARRAAAPSSAATPHGKHQSHAPAAPRERQRSIKKRLIEVDVASIARREVAGLSEKRERFVRGSASRPRHRLIHRRAAALPTADCRSRRRSPGAHAPRRCPRRTHRRTRSANERTGARGGRRRARLESLLHATSAQRLVAAQQRVHHALSSGG